MPKKKFYSHLYFQVLTGIALGVALGFAAPDGRSRCSRSVTRRGRSRT
jgi:Na+/H+-dicarboxylate symporter